MTQKTIIVSFGNFVHKKKTNSILMIFFFQGILIENQQSINLHQELLKEN